MEGIKAVYASGFSGVMTCRILGKIEDTHRDNVSDYLVKITSKKNHTYKYGEIMSVMEIDLFDKETINLVKGKTWKNAVIAIYIRQWYNGGKNFTFVRKGEE